MLMLLGQWTGERILSPSIAFNYLESSVHVSAIHTLGVRICSATDISPEVRVDLYEEISLVCVYAGRTPLAYVDVVE